MRNPTDHALARCAASGSGEVLLYGLTPPPADQLADKVAGAAERTRGRLMQMRVDAVAVYDLVDEPGRSEAARPFPFTPTLDATEYAHAQLRGLDVPVIHYRNVVDRSADELRSWAGSLEDRSSIVLVGGGSSDTPMVTSLPRAQEIVREARPDVLLGAVTIPERHAAKHDEHERLVAKQEAGCGFFISQVVYDPGPALALLEDYARLVGATAHRPAPLVFALSLCGSARQLDLLAWLGVAVPDDVAAALRRSEDTREVSRQHCLTVAGALAERARGLGLPFGFLVESVSDLRPDTDATVELAAEVGALLRR